MNVRKLLFSSIVMTTVLSVAAQAQTSASWMEGKFGLGFRINADNKTNIENYNPDKLVRQISGIRDLEYVIINLSDAAHGDAYLAPHSILTTLNPGSTPNNDRDLFLEIATGLQNKGIKVIAYMATQGPAMLKHGAEKAFDGVLNPDGTWSSQSMDNWAGWVEANYGAATVDNYKTAYAEVIVTEYANRYGMLIDGWWFDHAGLGNIPLLEQVTHTANPNAALAFNTGQKVPLINNSPGYEDFTGGHPNPVARTPANDPANLPMVESIEATTDGYVDDGAGVKSLGHMFIPLAEKWNSGEIVWDVEQAADWQQRVNNACGAWTWNIATSDASSALDNEARIFVKDIQAEITDNGGITCF